MFRASRLVFNLKGFELLLVEPVSSCCEKMRPVKARGVVRDSLSLHLFQADSPQPSAFVSELCSAYGAHVLI